jgi:IS30 family transposase
MKHLTKEQRYQIEAYVKAGKQQKWIAEELGVSNSTISRELKRNKSKRGKYIARIAIEYSQERKERFCYRRKFTKSVERRVRSYLENEQWSPEQIVGYCKKENIEMVSVERIYQYIRNDRLHGGELYKHLRHKLKHRKRPVNDSKVRIKDRVSIEQRPEKVNNREEFGHFEMDLVVGKNNKGAILTITERKTGHLICRHLPGGKNARQVAKAVIEELLPFKEHVHSITTDNGLEFAEHKAIAKKLDATIYFTHPYCSWEKGQIEYCNKLLRQYIPKHEIINEVNTMNLKQIQMKINRRPRKKLGFKKPFELFYNFINHKVAFAS